MALIRWHIARAAYVCTHKDCEGLRVFVFPGEDHPSCPNGHGKMTRQPNKPYKPSRRKS